MATSLSSSATNPSSRTTSVITHMKSTGKLTHPTRQPSIPPRNDEHCIDLVFGEYVAEPQTLNLFDEILALGTV
ncbi:MAG: hypothetical protein R3C20_04225 [Planctomycetaceae bacterium]